MEQEASDGNAPVATPRACHVATPPSRLPRGSGWRTTPQHVGARLTAPGLPPLLTSSEDSHPRGAWSTKQGTTWDMMMLWLVVKMLNTFSSPERPPAPACPGPQGYGSIALCPPFPHLSKDFKPHWSTFLRSNMFFKHPLNLVFFVNTPPWSV